MCFFFLNLLRQGISFPDFNSNLLSSLRKLFSALEYIFIFCANEEEFVCAQIPVFLSKILADKLFIIQYPTYMKDGCDNATISKTSIKPENQEVRMELAIDTDKLSYDHDVGKKLALVADGKSAGNDDEGVFSRYLKENVVERPSKER